MYHKNILLFSFSVLWLLFVPQLEATSTGENRTYRGCYVNPSNTSNLKLVHKFNTMHVSCSSYKPKKWLGNENLGGVVLYMYKGKTDWHLNDRHCQSGYIILKRIEDLKQIRNGGKEPGQIHGAVYKSVFNETLNVNEVLGGGFSYKDKEWKFNSWTLNAPSYGKDHYHDGKKKMNDKEVMLIQTTLKHWMKTGNSTHSFPVSISLYGDPKYKNTMPVKTDGVCILL